jgi:hypothetical protein
MRRACVWKEVFTHARHSYYAALSVSAVARGPTRFAMRSLVKTSGRPAGVFTTSASSMPTALSALFCVSRITSDAAVKR